MFFHEDKNSIVVQLSNAQQDDVVLKFIVESVLNGSCNDYILWNNISYENYNSDMPFVILKAMQVNIIKKTHEKNHFGMRNIKQLSKWNFGLQTCVKRTFIF